MNEYNLSIQLPKSIPTFEKGLKDGSLTKNGQ